MAELEPEPLTVAKLIELLQRVPPDLPVAVPGYNNETTFDVEVTLSSVYGISALLIAPPEEE